MTTDGSLPRPGRGDTGTGPGIVLDHGEYWLQNKGDLAMLEMTVRRIGERWPDVRIGVPTFDPALLRSYVPRVEPLAVSTGGDWPARTIAGAVAGHAPPRVVGPLTRSWRTATRPARAAVRRLRAHRHGAPAAATAAPEVAPGRPVPRVPRVVHSASLVIALGGGYLADVDRNQAHRTLDLLDEAIRSGIPTAMLGQGIGPLEDPVLVDRAREVLPRVDLIGLREPVHGPALLRSLGVAPERVTVTGDDAVELAYRLRRSEPGTGIGVGIRIADYSPVPAGAGADVRRAVHDFGYRVSGQLVPIAVSTYLNQDRRAARPIVRGYPDVAPMPNRYGSAQDLGVRVGQCAVLVTGAYHAAVFALAQGIPTITLSASEYYDYKFAGLEAMFGTGVTRLSWHDDDIRERLLGALDAAWRAGPQLRDALLASAEQQVALSRAFFARVCDLLPTAPQT